MEIRPGVKIVEGRMFTPATNEAIVSRKLAKRFASMKVGETLKTGSFRWVVVGLFDADGSAYESEIWTDVTDLQQQTKRNIVSTVFVRLPDPDAASRFIETIKGDQRLKLEGKTERKYFDEQMITADPIKALAFIVGLFTAIGAAFGAMNTMYAQVSARTREIGTLRAIGFSRRSILVSFVLEAILLCLIGGLLGIVFTFLVFNLVLTHAHGHDELPHVFGGALQFPDDARADHGGPRLRARHGNPRWLVSGVPRGAPEDHDGASGALMRRGRAGWLLAAVCLAFPGALRGAAQIVVVGDAYDGGQLSLAPGDELRVRLESRADAAWAVAFSDAAVLRALPADAAAPDPGFQSFRFQAVALGSSALGLVCWKSSSPAAPPAGLFRIQITVKERVTRRALLLEEPDDGSGIYLSQGDVIAVKLPSNPTTGYSWSIAANTPSVLQPAGDARYDPPPTPKPGASGFQTFEFRVASGGPAALLLVYRRPFEKDAPPARTWSVFVAAAAQK